MSANSQSRRKALVFCAWLGLMVPSWVVAATVDAHSTTLLLIRDQARDGTTYTLAPLYELLSVSARDVENPLAENLQLTFSGWGAASIGSNLVWYDTTRPQHNLFGDVDLAYVQGEVLGRTVQLRLGRQLVAGGVTRSLQLDGANLLLRLPAGFGLSAYVGSPVSQRLDARGTPSSWNPHQGNFATGGRAYWVLPRWVEVGFSVVDVEDRGDPSRRQIGGDLRFTPWERLTVFANTSYDLYENRWAETSLMGQLAVVPQLLVSLDYRHVEPDLLLARDSLLAVFVVDRRNEVGGSVQYDPLKSISVVFGYHYLREETTADGHRAEGRVTWHPGKGTALGVEIGKLRTVDNGGYFQLRAFGHKQLGQLTGTLDLQEYAFQQPVNGQKNSLLVTAALGYALGGGWTALVSGTGGATPYYERRFDLLAKVTYGQTYRFREVR